MFTHLYRRAVFSLSPITLILDSVPDFLTKILPLPLINLSAFFMIFFISGLLIIFLSLTSIFSKSWGVFLNWSKNSLAFFPFLKAKRAYKATSKPSPVVANLPKIICPDCSPPKLKLYFFIFSLTYLSPTFALKNFIPFDWKYFSKP